MLCLIFRLEADRYAIDIAHISEVLPWVEAKAVPGTPVGVAGIINYHGAPVPLIDLCHLTVGRPARFHMSTRIVLVKYRAVGGDSRFLGLLAEGVTGVERFAADQFVEGGVRSPGAPYLGPVVTDGRGTLQRVEVDDLLPAEITDQLFQAAAAVR